MACKLLTNTDQFKYWFTRSCFPIKPTANTAERKEPCRKNMQRCPILNNCVCHDQDLTLLGSRPTIITTQIYYYHCPDLLLLRSKPPTITSTPITITFQPYYYNGPNLLLFPTNNAVSMEMKLNTQIFGRWMWWKQTNSVMSAHPMEGCY
jgi:hypothetical protein